MLIFSKASRRFAKMNEFAGRAARREDHYNAYNLEF
jgi:hypothetical protein